MTDRARRMPAVVIGVLSTVVVVLVLLLIESCSRQQTGRVVGSGSAGPVRIAVGDVSGFRISGSLTTHLAPGRSGGIDVRIRNERDEELTVTGITPLLVGIDAPNATPELPCTLSDFSASAAHTDSNGSPLAVTVGPRAATSFSSLGVDVGSWPTVTMIDTDQNQDGCSGATVRLQFEGSGVLAP